MSTQHAIAAMPRIGTDAIGVDGAMRTAFAVSRFSYPPGLGGNATTTEVTAAAVDDIRSDTMCIKAAE